MTLETFFEKFELFADAPGAVGRMRELVLSLAVQGWLIQQDPADEDVELSLTRNDEARRTAAKSDRRADVENQPLLSADDRWEIARSWSWRALADLVLFVDYRGKTPAKLSEGIRLLTAKNVRKGEINLAPEEFLSEEEYHAWMTRGFPKAGDVLFTTEAPMGNAAVVKLTDRFALAQRVICFQSYGAIDSSFLVLQILSTQFQVILDKNGTGVTAKGIKASKLKQLPIAVPPLAEQKRIVAKVEELMALCDRLEAQQQEREDRSAALARASLTRFAEAPTPANLHHLFHPSYAISPAELRKAILTLAVQGKLVPQDLDDEPAEEWLQTIEEPTSNKNTGNEIGIPTYSLPDQWIWLTMSAVFEVAGGIQKTPHRTPRNNAHPYLGVGNVYRGRLDLRNIKEFELEPGELERRRLIPGDLLIIEGNGSFNEIGRCAKWSGEIENCVHQNHVIRCRPFDSRISDFVLLFLNSPNGVEIMQRLAITSSGLYSLSVGKIRQIEVPLPPLAEQSRIVAKVDQLMALVDELETQLAASRATAAKLLDALVAELTSSH